MWFNRKTINYVAMKDVFLNNGEEEEEEEGQTLVGIGGIIIMQQN